MTFPPAAYAFMVGNSLLLGMRHGVDWDHVAAIMDIVGTTATTSGASGVVPGTKKAGPLLLSTIYALGHSLVIVGLALAAFAWSASLPRSVSQAVTKLVGASLLIFGVLVLYLLRRPNLQPLGSRYLLVWDWMVQCLRGWRRGAGSNKSKHRGGYARRTVFSIGALHGLGAETGTQILLIASVAAVGGMAGAMMVAAFIGGFVLSNAAVAGMVFAGLGSRARLRPLYLFTGVTTGTFSIFVGLMFMLGWEQSLPELPDLVASTVRSFVLGI